MMSGFSADWLRLREPCDARSRSEELARALGARLPLRPLQAVDLGTGTAANIRYLAPRLEGEQSWLAIDDDPALIGQLPRELKGPAFQCRVSARQLDLATGLDALPLAGCQLVTASALLDLVSASWLQLLAARCEAAGAAVLFALNYDGRMQCAPREPDDDWLCELVNRHQQGDKGFGPALGPWATRHACALFEALGFGTRIAASDWVIEADERALQQELIDGWIAAALELVPGDRQRIVAWGARRRAHLVAGDSRLRVGHHDFIAWPTAAGG
jgi:hypothetical protein